MKHWKELEDIQPEYCENRGDTFFILYDKEALDFEIGYVDDYDIVHELNDNVIAKHQYDKYLWHEIPSRDELTTYAKDVHLRKMKEERDELQAKLRHLNEIICEVEGEDK